MDNAMKLKESLSEKAKTANGRSQACEKCPFHPCSISLMQVCSRAFVEGYKKGYKQRSKEVKNEKI